MADFGSSLPIRTENAGDAIVKVADATVPSQQLKVESDGSINVNAAFSPGTEVKITDGTDDLAVNGDGSINVVATATNLDIRDLVFATDKVDASGTTLGANSGVDIGDVTINNAAGAAAVNIQDGGNSITVDGSVTVSATDLDIRNLSAAQDNVAISDGTDTLAVNGDGSINSVVTATNLDIRDLTHASDSVKVGDGTDFLAVNSDGSINVKVSDRSGTEVDSYDTTAAVAGGATDNHDYTTTGAFRLTSVEASGSGKMKIEVQVETAAASGVFNTKCVMFNSTSTPNMSFIVTSPILVASGARVRIIRTNRDNQAQDVYSTILGYNE